MLPFQFINLCSPPIFSSVFVPGRKYKWYVLDKIHSAPTSRMSSAVRAFTQACVATGIKTGVCTAPCLVYKTPVRALERVSLLKILKGEISVIFSILAYMGDGPQKGVFFRLQGGFSVYA